MAYVAERDLADVLDQYALDPEPTGGIQCIFSGRIGNRQLRVSGSSVFAVPPEQTA
jgi:hypothetical protein